MVSKKINFSQYTLVNWTNKLKEIQVLNSLIENKEGKSMEQVSVLGKQLSISKNIILHGAPGTGKPILLKRLLRNWGQRKKMDNLNLYSFILAMTILILLKV